jgi:hypothetical protein
MATTPAAGPRKVKITQELDLKPGESLADVVQHEEQEKDGQSIWEFMERALPERWERDLILYLYRHDVPGNPRSMRKNLAKLAQPIDEDFVARKFGPGTYSIILKDGPQRTRSTSFTIDDNYIGARAGSDQADGAQINLGRPDVLNQAMAGSMLSPIEAARASVKLFTETASQSIASIIAAQPKQPSVLEIIETAKALRSEDGMSSFWKDAGPVLTPLVAAIVTGVCGWISRAFEPEDASKKLDSLMALATRVSTMGAGGGSAADWRGEAIKVMPQLLGEIRNIMGEGQKISEAALKIRQIEEARMSRQERAGTQPAVRVSVEETTTAREPAAPANVSAAAAPGPIPNQVTEYGVKVKVVEMFQRGRTGYETGLFVDELMPRLVMFIAQMNRDQMLQLIERDEVFRQMMQDGKHLERLPQFVDEMIEYARDQYKDVLDQAGKQTAASQPV